MDYWNFSLHNCSSRYVLCIWPNPLTLLFVCTISGAAMIYSIKLEASALKEKKIDVSQGSKTGNALAKWLGIIMLLVIVLPILLRVFGFL